MNNSSCVSTLNYQHVWGPTTVSVSGPLLLRRGSSIMNPAPDLKIGEKRGEFSCQSARQPLLTSCHLFNVRLVTRQPHLGYSPHPMLPL